MRKETAAEPAPVLPGRAEETQVPAPEIRTEEPSFSRAYESYGDNVDYEAYDEHWKPPGLLDAPDPRPGFVQRWVAVTIGGEHHALNVNRRMAEKWRPRDPSTVPGGFQAPTISHGNFVGCIGVEGMVLMERPRMVHDAHAQRVRTETEKQMAAVKGELHREEKIGDRAQGYSNIQGSSARRVTAGGQVMPADDDD